MTAKLTQADMDASSVKTMARKSSPMTITLTAWVMGSPNTVPVATAQFRSESLATDTERVWKRSFRVERSNKA